MLRSICMKYTKLTDIDIELLQNIEKSIQYTADLSAADIFIDCQHKDGERCIVVAEAKPKYHYSVYKSTVSGECVEQKNEPAVFTAFETGMPIRDTRAITQENRSVQQVVVPIKNAEDKTIGVLIQEKDITDILFRDKKMQALEKTSAKQQEQLYLINGSTTPISTSIQYDQLVMKEIHHRIKNNLQTVASILSIQAKRSNIPEVKAAFRENVSRVLSFSTIHDILTKEGTGLLSIKDLLMKVCQNIRICSDYDGKKIEIFVDGENIFISSDKVTSIALLVNELVMNSLKHAFKGRKGGSIYIQIQGGNQYGLITVQDDGVGFPENRINGFGMELIQMTVRDKLHGNLKVNSSEKGTTVGFDFPIN